MMSNNCTFFFLNKYFHRAKMSNVYTIIKILVRLNEKKINGFEVMQQGEKVILWVNFFL